MTTAIATAAKNKGMGFLIEDLSPHDIFTTEDLTEEHRAIGRTVDEFWANEVEPNLPAIRAKQPGVALDVVRRAVPLALNEIVLREKYRGRETDLASVMVVRD